MSKLILIFLIFACSQKLFSQETASAKAKIQGSKELPLELNLMIESLQNAITENQSLSLSDSTLDSIMHIDSYARLLSKEDIFLIGKIEIYKTLLKTNTFPPKAVIDGNSIKTLRGAIKNSTDPFMIWFFQALLHDCETLLASTAFKDYLLQKNAGRLERPDARKIDKKVQLIYRWVSKINPDSPDFQEILKAELVPVMNESLKNIEESFFLMAAGTSFQPIPKIITSTEEFKFFSLQKTKKKTVKAEIIEKSVDDILAPITNEGITRPESLPPPSKEDWLNDENAPANLKNLPKPSDDADWLQDF